jgi:hypothetical protein
MEWRNKKKAMQPKPQSLQTQYNTGCQPFGPPDIGQVCDMEVVFPWNRGNWAVFLTYLHARPL